MHGFFSVTSLRFTPSGGYPSDRELVPLKSEVGCGRNEAAAGAGANKTTEERQVDGTIVGRRAQRPPGPMRLQTFRGSGRTLWVWGRRSESDEQR